MKKNILIAAMIIGTVISAQAKAQQGNPGNPVETVITTQSLQDAIGEAIKNSMKLGDWSPTIKGYQDESLDPHTRQERMYDRNTTFNSADYASQEEFAYAVLDRYCNQIANNGVFAGVEGGDPREGLRFELGYRYNVEVHDNGDGTYQVFMLIACRKSAEDLSKSYE